MHIKSDGFIKVNVFISCVFVLLLYVQVLGGVQLWVNKIM